MFILNFDDIAASSGFTPDQSGRLVLPATQDTADAIGKAALALCPAWQPGDAPLDVTMTGAGPVWAYLVIGHSLHGRVRKLMYSAPNAPLIVVFNHGDVS